MRSKTMVLVFCLSFFFFLSSPVFAQEYKLNFQIVPIGYHYHAEGAENSPSDDGKGDPIDTIFLLRRAGLMGAIFTPHSKGMRFAKFKEQIEDLSLPDFIVFAGCERDIVRDDLPTLCHIGIVNADEEACAYSTKYDWDKVSEPTKQIRDGGGLVVANHLKWCRVWSDTRYLYLFNYIEMFNDYSPSPMGFKKNYEFHRDAYIKALASGHRAGVLAGMDAHILVQNKIFEAINYVFPDEFSRESITTALKEGRTIATNYLRVKRINRYPAFYPFTTDDIFEISGAIEFTHEPLKKPDIIVYKNGVETTSLKLKKEGKEFSFRFRGEIDQKGGVEDCYVLEIPENMMTSPFCFTKTHPRFPNTYPKATVEPYQEDEEEELDEEEEAEVEKIEEAVEEVEDATPKIDYEPLRDRVIKIKKAWIDEASGGINFETENDALMSPYRFYMICGEKSGLLYTEQNKLVTCIKPLMTVFVYKNDEGKEMATALETSSPCNLGPIQILMNSCVEEIQRGYFVGIGTREFRGIVRNVLISDDIMLVTENKSVVEGETFYACDPKGKFKFNALGDLEDCSRLYTMTTTKVEGKELMRLTGVYFTFESNFIMLRK